MMRSIGREWVFRARGPWAHWGGITTGPERHTMICPSHSAVVGLLRCVYGKWEYRWSVSSVALLSQPKIVPVAFNQIKEFSNVGPVFQERQRTQRVWTLVQDPDYLIRARITRGKHADPEDTIEKADAMIASRLQSGYEHRTPCFGLQELFAELQLVEDESTLPSPVDVSENYGISFYDIDVDDKPDQPAYLAPLKVERGVVHYPTFDEVRALGLRYQLPRRA